MEYEKINKAIKDLNLHLKNNKQLRREIIVVIEEQERQLKTLEIIKNQ
tara:strand:- start:358 stop:501 length:144 start_codon:yes stop_codon:yes gene_type:complete